jgi:DNA (cytosine-5)-methyltransferase 1
VLTFGSLFAGIGGLDLGLERAGFECVWQVEIDPFARAILEMHFPKVKRHDDVRTWPKDSTERVNVICGGFPCQDISSSNGSGKGLDGERSSLWFQYQRIIRILQPDAVIVENVPAITFRGLDRVLGSLAKIGFDAEWQTIPASAFGSPQQRDRVFIVAYPASKRSASHAVFENCDAPGSGEKQTLRERGWPGVCKSGEGLPDRIRWIPNGDVCGMVNGISDRLDRYRVLGNAVVPQVGEFVGNAVRKFLESKTANHS